MTTILNTPLSEETGSRSHSYLANFIVKLTHVFLPTIFLVFSEHSFATDLTIDKQILAAGPTLPVTMYSYKSAPGDYIGAGISNQYTPANATLSLSGNANFLTFSVNTSTEFWDINLAAPQGEKLRPGIFYNAERAAFRTGRAPGLDVGGDGRGCNEVWGMFSINQIATNSSGQVTLLDATFTQRCEFPTAPTLTGVVKYKALPLSYSFKSDSGDYIGSGLTKTYLNNTSLFSLIGNDISLQYNVSGKRDYWTAQIAAPTGQHLHTGTYPIARFPDAKHAGLDVYGNGRGCNMTTGTLTITAITRNASGSIIGLGATFEQHCEGAAAALRGTIHHYN